MENNYGALSIGGDDDDNVQEALPLPWYQCLVSNARYILVGIVSVFASLGFLFILLNSHHDDYLYRVYIIRHAEMKYQPLHKCKPYQYPELNSRIGKCPPLGDNLCGGNFLIESGLTRAQCIAQNVSFHNLRIIIAENPGTCEDDTKVKREYQTVLPLSLKTNIHITSDFSRGEEKHAANYITHNNTIKQILCPETIKHSYSIWKHYNYTINSVLISWNHENMPIIMKALGCKRSSLCSEIVDRYEFDKVYELLYSCHTGKFHQITQFRERCSHPQ